MSRIPQLSRGWAVLFLTINVSRITPDLGIVSRRFFIFQETNAERNTLSRSEARRLTILENVQEFENAI